MLRRRLQDKAWTALSIVAVLLAVAPLLSILAFVTLNGLPSVNLRFLTSLPPLPGAQGGGIADAIQGSAILVGLASVIGIPVGILSGIYVSEYGRGKYAQTVRLLADALAGAPSIVTGIFVYALIVLSMKQYSAFAGGFALGIMMIPIVSNTTSEALKLVPNSLREASAALGVRKWRTIMLAIANAKGGTVTGILLSIARVFGETAPLLLTSLGSQYFFTGLFQPVGALTLTIYHNATSGDPYLITQAYGASFILLVAVLAINLLVKAATRGRFGHA